MTRPGLSKNQRCALHFIEGFVDVSGFSPSIRAISKGTGLGLSVAHAAVRALLKKGYLVAEIDSAGHITKGSLAIVPTPAKANVTVFIAPNGEYVRTESSGDVSVTVKTHFPPLEGAP
jgi:SOS-response transcriptional repressor LexA